MARAAILGCLGPTLTPGETAFLRDADPWGFILFARNVESPAQVAALVSALRETVGRRAPVLIDQEGGRVARLRPPHWRGWQPVADMIGALEEEADILEALTLRYRLIAHELHALGIDVNCAPLLDVPQPGAHDVIGNRAIGTEPAHIALRGREIAEALRAGGVLPVIKHIPGHGRGMADSHLALPSAEADAATLRAVDFLPFRALRDQALGMTAHMVYPAIDPERCATLSPEVIAVIRGEIGFDGLLMTDDLSMKALTGSFGARTRDALAAGCDVVLHCNGDPEEMRAVMAACPELSGTALARAERAEAARRAPAPFDVAAADARFAALAGAALHA
ncbi:beta-N-acetylhexosaminidase [Paroceanicella profunda]|uniref:beta-N-acetylhexosaminidase n=1 Tax=Paroceanicella profunda TaxID=2579971 RepID=A0A5B8G2J3_9RHOB|nr:beta-N-acetylhexosaminidase [Paroceanicella profunda]